MFKSLAALSLMLITTLASQNLPKQTDNSVILYVKSTQAIVNGNTQKMDCPPVIENGITLVPLRFITEALGASANWNQENQTAEIKYSDITVTIKSDNNQMDVNGNKVTLLTPPKIVNGRILVPLRAISDSMGKETFYEKGLIVISDNKLNLDKTQVYEYISKLNGLPIVGTFEKFEEVVGKDNLLLYQADGAANSGAMDLGNTMWFSKESSSEAAMDETKKMDYSETNVQVQGVDEADIIKTDGQFVYLVNNNKIQIVKALPAESMELCSTMEYTENPIEIFIDGDTLVVILGTYTDTKIIEYNIKDRKNVSKTRELSIDGNYISSRKTGKDVYVITNSYSVFQFPREMTKNKQYMAVNDVVKPKYTDSITGKTIITDFDSMFYFPNCRGASFLTIAGFTTESPFKEASVQTYVGGGDSVYMSKDNLYVTTTDYAQNEQKTTVYKFALSEGLVTYSSKQSLPGTILNQFSMDEDKGYFRITTTSFDKNYKESNNLFVLNENMDIIGKITDIAPGERIYSTRFMGNRAYVVTFKTVDPLFVIDLANPANPKILGALKIPGYSDYLHPYDDNHLIGFGKDTVEIKGTAYATGIKISMFDVTDVEHPIELFKEIIGGRGTHSDILSNHKALLFNKHKNLMAFPISVLEPFPGRDPIEYGQFMFQGAYIYNVDLQNGFANKGKITHLTKDDILKTGTYGGNFQNYVNRIVTIGNTFYTFSENELKATAPDMTTKSVVKLNNNSPK